MEKLTLQQLINQTQEGLIQAGASNYYQNVFKTLTKQLLLYAEKHNTDSFSMDFGLQFLEDHYSMSSKIKQKKWCAAYSRCINALAEYQRSGNVVLYLAMDKRAYTFPEVFRYSAEAYISHREDIGIIKKSNKIFSLYLERFFAFLSRKNIASLDTLSLKDVLDFMPRRTPAERTKRWQDFPLPPLIPVTPCVDCRIVYDNSAKGVKCVFDMLLVCFCTRHR